MENTYTDRYGMYIDTTQTYTEISSCEIYMYASHWMRNLSAKNIFELQRNGKL